MTRKKKCTRKLLQKIIFHNEKSINESDLKEIMFFRVNDTLSNLNINEEKNECDFKRCDRRNHENVSVKFFDKEEFLLKNLRTDKIYKIELIYAFI